MGEKHVSEMRHRRAQTCWWEENTAEIGLCRWMLGGGKGVGSEQSLPIDCSIMGEGRETDYTPKQRPTANHSFRHYLRRTMANSTGNQSWLGECSAILQHKGVKGRAGPKLELRKMRRNWQEISWRADDDRFIKKLLKSRGFKLATLLFYETIAKYSKFFQPEVPFSL